MIDRFLFFLFYFLVFLFFLVIFEFFPSRQCGLGIHDSPRGAMFSEHGSAHSALSSIAPPQSQMRWRDLDTSMSASERQAMIRMAAGLDGSELTSSQVPWTNTNHLLMQL